jgi:hypothetical protein
VTVRRRGFLDAVAVGQVTPGPLTIMNAFIGVVAAGIAGGLFLTVNGERPTSADDSLSLCSCSIAREEVRRTTPAGMVRLRRFW